MQPVILWDVDSTLVERDVRTNLFDVAFEEMFGIERPQGVVIDRADRLDGDVAREYMRLGGSDDFDGFMKTLDKVSVDFYKENTLSPIPGVADTLARLVSMGAVNGLYTGDTPQRAMVKLAAAGITVGSGINGLRYGAMFCNGYRASHLSAVATVLKRFQPDGLIVVGGTARGHALAAALGCRFWQVGEEEIDDTEGLRFGWSPDFDDVWGEAFVTAVESLA